VRDNGVGFPPGFVIASSNSMGLQLVQDLARQLGGTFTVESEPGRTHCCVTFPAERAN
jgi:two-component sensor histidine kinase